MLADHLHGQAVAQHGVMSGAKNLRETEFVTRCVLAGVEAETDETLGLVERDPMGNAVGEAIDHNASVISKPARALRVEPATAAIEFVGIIPVKQRDPRLNAGGEQLIHQPVVERQAGFIDRAGATRNDPWPREREAVGFEAELSHQSPTFGYALIVLPAFLPTLPP